MTALLACCSRPPACCARSCRLRRAGRAPRQARLRGRRSMRPRRARHAALRRRRRDAARGAAPRRQARPSVALATPRRLRPDAAARPHRLEAHRQERRRRNALGRHQRHDRRCSSACSRTAAASPGPGRSPATTSAAAPPRAASTTSPQAASSRRCRARSRRSAFAPRPASTASTCAARSGAATWRSSTRCSATPHWPRDQGRHPLRRGRQRASVPRRAQPAATAPGRRARRAEGDRARRGQRLAQVAERPRLLAGVDARARSRRDPNADPDRASLRPRRDQGDACRSARKCGCSSTGARRSSAGPEPLAARVARVARRNNARPRLHAPAAVLQRANGPARSYVGAVRRKAARASGTLRIARVTPGAPGMRRSSAWAAPSS